MTSKNLKTVGPGKRGTSHLFDQGKENTSSLVVEFTTLDAADDLGKSILQMHDGLGTVTHRVRLPNPTTRLGGGTLGDRLSCSNSNWIHSIGARGMVSTVVEDPTLP